MIFKNKICLLTVVITFVVITAAFISMMVGRNVIIDSQNDVAEKRMEKLSNELLNEYEYYGEKDVSIMRFFKVENQNGIVCVLEDDSNAILELYINFTQISLHEPIASLIPEINRIFEMDTEDFVADYCKERDMDYQTTPISETSADGLFDLIEILQEETGVQL